MVFDVMRALARRWYVVLAGLLLTAGLVFGAYKASPPEYNARALVLLLPSNFDVGKGGNPLLRLDGLEQPASILSAYFASAPVLAEVAQLSPTAEFEVDLDPSTRGPVIAVDVTDKTAADTLRVRDYLLTRIPTELQRLQQEADARQSAFVDSMLLVADTEAKVDFHGTIRIMVAALVVGLVGTGISAFAIDGLMGRRRLSEAPPGVAGSEGTAVDAAPEGVPEEVLATGRSGSTAVDAAPEGVPEEVLATGRSGSTAVDAAPEGVPEEVLATGRSGSTAVDAAPEGVPEEVLATGRSGSTAVDAAPEGVPEEVLATGRSGSTAVDAAPEGVPEEVLATGRSGYTTGNGVSHEVGTNAPFDMWPEAPWATEDARGFDTVPPGRRMRREP